jgi:mannosyltransferase
MITFDGVIFTQRNNRGGVSGYFRKLLQFAARQMPDVAVLVHDRRLTGEHLGCEPRQVMYRPPRFLERYRSVRQLPAGLLHTSYYRTSPQRNVRNVVSVYDFTYEKYSSGIRALVHSTQKRNAILRADAVICISENTRRDLSEWIPRCSPNKIFVTHLAADDDFFPIEERDASITDQPFVLFVGGRDGYKNFSAAVDAMSLTKDCAIVCVGGGPFTEEERDGLQHKLPGRHFHAGAVDNARLNRLYNSAVCLLYPSFYEGFGIPPLEAMKAGCPFIALNRSSLPEVAGKAGIMLEEESADALSSAIDECRAAGRREELRRAGFAQASLFSWQRTFEQTLPIYRSLLS